MKFGERKLILVLAFSLLMNFATADHFCGYHHDSDKNLGMVLLDEPTETETLTFLGEDEWQPIRIYLDYSMLESQRHSSELERNIKSMMSESVRVFQSLLKVKPVRVPLKVAKASCNEISLSSAVTNYGVSADIVIVPFIDFTMGGATVAAAGACDIDQKNFRPILGRIGFNQNNDFASKTKLLYNMMVTIHELTHVFVFSPNLFTFFIDSKGNRLQASDVIYSTTINYLNTFFRYRF